MPEILADTAPQPTRLADYRLPDFLIDAVDLVFDLDPAKTRVASHITLRRNPNAGTPRAPLRQAPPWMKTKTGALLRRER